VLAAWDQSRRRPRPGHGRLDVSRFPASRQGELTMALCYLVQSPTLRTVVRRIAESGNVVFLEYHAAHTKMLHHNPANLRIQWNPRLGLKDVSGWMSPALLLAHELAHAQFTPRERSAMLACDRPQGFDCEAHGVEEALIISEVEHPAARELNAARVLAGLLPLESATRTQRQLGRLIEVASPLSTCPDEVL
jgi:hypothetical protein